ncbi:MAG: helix-turn-helix transcriptional regulator [Eggerthellaceae bacterium]|nr:helix-turn-helix transcriptional regulator [Eggerthellaceae bacterium]
MTQSISNAEAVSGGGFTERSMLGMLGYTLFMTGQLSFLYSPIVATASTVDPVAFCLMRFLALGLTAATYFALYRFVKNRDALVRSRAVKGACYGIQMILPALVALETLTGTVVPAPLAALAWACCGCTHALLTCSWIDAKSNLEESDATKVAFWSFAVTAFLLVGMMSLSRTASLVALVVVEAISCWLLLIAPPHRGQDMDEHDEEWLRTNSPFRRSGSYVLTVDGALISFCAGVMIVGGLRGHLPLMLAGVAFIGTALIFYLMKHVNPALLSLERSQLVLLPVLAGGLAIMSDVTMPALGVVALVLFSLSYLFDFANRSILSLRGNLLSLSSAYCFSKGRLFIILGQALGWVGVAFLASPMGSGFAPVLTTALLILMCAYIAIGTLNPKKYPLIDEVADEDPEPMAAPAEAPEEPAVVERPYKNRCLKAAQHYDLTPREGEILSYLARGRNAKYIADQLFVAERTVKTHTYHIYQKMGIHSQQELINIVEGTEKDPPRGVE